jgi:hypothetical protein
MAEPPYGEIADLMKKGEIVPFLGAGVNFGARPPGATWSEATANYLPSGAELSRYLAGKVSFPSQDPHDLSDLAKVSSYYAEMLGRRRLRERLGQLFCHEFNLCDIHTYLAEVAAHMPLLIVTTNYDNLIEFAFNKAGRAYDRVIHPTDRKDVEAPVLWWKYGATEPIAVEPNILPIDLKTTTVIYKMHGTVDCILREWDSYVITEDDYVDFLARMMSRIAVPAPFMRHFKTRNLLFLGCGLNDWNVRVILKNLETTFPSGDVPAAGQVEESGLRAWAIQFCPSEFEVELWRARDQGIRRGHQSVRQTITRADGVRNMATNTPPDFCPYKGLQPYTEADRAYFFGRARDQEIVASNLYAAPLTILYGASGVGKASVLLAGVVPELRQTPRLAVVVFRAWQDENFLAALKAQTLDAAQKSLGKPIAVDTNLPFDDFVNECAKALRGNIFFILDQFEEYFLYHAPTTDDTGFDAEFARAVNRREIAANVLLGMREDSLSRLDRLKRRIANLLGNLLRLEHLDHDAAVSAIRKPLAEYNRHLLPEQAPVSIEDELVETIITQVQTGSVALGRSGVGQLVESAATRVETPYLQLGMTRLWEEECRAGSHVLRLVMFKRLGGAQPIVRTHLDTTMRGSPGRSAMLPRARFVTWLHHRRPRSRTPSPALPLMRPCLRQN